MNRDDTYIVVKGSQCIVEYGVLDDGSSPARDFLQGLQLKDRSQFVATFLRVAHLGIFGVKNEDRFKQARAFWAAKNNRCSGGPEGLKRVRIVGFRKRDQATGVDRLILTHGFWKSRVAEWPESEFARAEAIRDEILARENREERGETT
jgi:hypothetical protein